MKTSAPQATDSPIAAVADAGQANDLASQLPLLRQRLLRQARFAVYDAALAEDLVQDTLLAVFEQASRHQGQASLTTWATAILKNKVADWYRSPNRTRFVQQADEPEDTELSDGLEALYDATGHYVEQVPKWQQPEHHMEQRQMFTILEQCAARLPRQTGRVFMMREWLGFETAEICTRLEISADNCRTTLHRARMGMRECMQIKWFGQKEAV
jgi:RNA polymerase sigma-70 factor, ECF subfamily